MKEDKKLLMATVFLLGGGTLSLLQSLGLWQLRYIFAASLATASGVCIVVAAVFIHMNSKHQVVWGVIAFFYSTMGFIAIGLAETDYLLSSAIFALLLGTIGSALTITQK